MSGQDLRRPNYHSYIESDSWRRRATAAKIRSGYRCQVCNRHAAEVKTLDAHHRTYERLGNERPEDLTVLCCDCHQLYEFHGKIDSYNSQQHIESSRLNNKFLHNHNSSLDKPSSLRFDNSSIEKLESTSKNSTTKTQRKTSHPIKVVGTIVVFLGSLILFGIWLHDDSQIKRTSTEASVATSSKSLFDCSNGCTSETPACKIKAQFGYSAGEKLYYLPDDPFYNSVKVDPTKGDKWFCNETDAVEDDWKRADSIGNSNLKSNGEVISSTNTSTQLTTTLVLNTPTSTPKPVVSISSEAAEATAWAEEKAELIAEGILPAEIDPNTCSYANRDSNLRAGPSTNYEIIGFASNGFCLPISGISDDGNWYAFRDETFYPLPYAWISAELVSNEPQNLQVVYPNVSPAVVPATNTPQLLQSCAGGCIHQHPGCDIKGNVAYETRERIYHVPGQEYYDSTKISPDYGERWFCTQQEALDAGWRRAYR